jgi:hypothetical protein
LRREDSTVHCIGVPDEAEEPLTTLHVPYEHSVVCAGGEHPSIIGSEGYPGQRIRVALVDWEMRCLIACFRIPDPDPIVIPHPRANVAAIAVVSQSQADLDRWKITSIQDIRVGDEEGVGTVGGNRDLIDPQASEIEATPLFMVDRRLPSQCGENHPALDHPPAPSDALSPAAADFLDPRVARQIRFPQDEED